MRIEKQFSPYKICIDSEQDRELLLKLCHIYEKESCGKWYNLGTELSQKMKEEIGRVRYLRELLR